MIPISSCWKATNQKLYMDECYAENMYSFRGKFTSEFERAMEKYLGSKHVIMTNTGTGALYAIYNGLGLKNKKVATNVLSYCSTSFQLKLVGASVEYVDCDKSLQIDLDKFEDVIKKYNIKYAVVAELYGGLPDMNRLMSFCANHDVTLVEDSAEALGSTAFYPKKKAGTFGVASAFSMFANKTIQCGEGGFVATDSDILATRIRGFCNNNQLKKYEHGAIGSNLRATNIQAAIALAQLEDIDTIIEKKTHIAWRYREEIDFRYSEANPHCDSGSWMQAYWLPEGQNYDDFDSYMTSRGIETRPVFKPMNQLVFRLNGNNSIEDKTPVAREAYNRCFSLPNFPDLTDEQVDYIIKTVNAYE